MSSAAELRKWMNRDNHDFAGNLRFGIQVWRSMEFVLITKHEIITEEFCRNLPKLRKELKRTGADPEVAWATICEFLALKHSAGSISINVKEQLVNIVKAEAAKTLKNPHAKVLEGLLLLLHSHPMQNYYRSTPDAFASLIGSCLRYLNALLEKKEEWLTSNDEVVVNLLREIRKFVKQTPQLDVFQKAFTTESFVSFAETLVILKEKGHDVTGEFFEIVHELYLPVASVASFKQYLVNAQEDSEFAALFETPVHALVCWLEAVLVVFKPDTEMQTLLHNFLFKRYFAVTQTRFESSSELLQCVSYYMCILKRHNAHMNTKMDNSIVSAFIGQHVEQLVNVHCETNPANVLDLLCATLRLEPMMLEHHLVTVSVRCMLLKKDDAILAIFAEFLCLVIDVFRRLSRTEKFMNQILNRLVAQLAQIKLSAKMKRKSMSSPGTAKKFKSQDGEEEKEEAIVDNTNRFFELLRSEFKSSPIEDVIDSKTNEFADIAFAWPPSVGRCFTRFISGLVTKPSLTIWKTLIYALTDCITLLKNGRLDTNTLFLVDITAAILCQYFDGARLAEHAHTSWDLISENLELTHTLLQEFGNAVLSQQHNNRTMNAFLKCCNNLANFELLCFYYWPDTSEAPESRRNIHAYLATQQWTLIEQRITNFGRSDCRANMNRIYMQRIAAAILFKPDRLTAADGLSATPVLASTLNDRYQIEAILTGESSKVFINALTASDTSKLCEFVLDSEAPITLFSRAVKNRQFVTILFVNIIKQLADRFGSKKSIFNALDFEQYLGDNVDYGTVAKELVNVVRQFVNDAPTLKKSDIAEIRAGVASLRNLPVEFVGVERRNFLFMLNVVLYVNVKATGDQDLVNAVLSYIKAFLHFGETPSLFGLLTIIDWINIFGGSTEALSLYRCVFEKSVKTLNIENTQMFDDLQQLLCAEKDADGREHVLDVGIILLDIFSKDKKCKKHLAQYRTAILARIRCHFQSELNGDHVAFTHRTIAGFQVILALILNNPELCATEMNTDLQAIYLVYLNHVSIVQYFGSCIKLLGLALTHQVTLNISDVQMRKTIDAYWSVYLTSLKSSEPNEEISSNVEQFLKTILNNKTPEEVIDLLDGADERDVDVVDTFTSYKHKLFGHIAKCQLNRTNGTLFIEILKQVSLRILMSIRLRGDLVDHSDAVQKLLDCHKLVCTNIQFPVSVELIDDILALLGEINIKRLFADPNAINNNNDNDAIVCNNPFANPSSAAKLVSTASCVDRSADFKAIHSRMSDVCFALIQHRHFFVVDRVPQYVTILRDLLMSVAWYKSGRKKASAALDNGEVTMLAELSHRMENIIKSFVKHGKEVKRIAPYLLIFTMNLMISNEQPTTVFSKIKTHFDSICYDLVSVCDDRIEGFIMRNCNEASKQMFEQTVKEYSKYHKFKGKV